MIKTCVLCTYWYLDPGHPDYSDITPGETAESGCYKDHWNIILYAARDVEYRQALLKAQKCSDFILADAAKEYIKENELK